MAVNLFFEARGESPLAKLWVLQIVENRVHSDEFPDSYCDVVFQKGAFSWTYFVERKRAHNWSNYINEKFPSEWKTYIDIYELSTFFYYSFRYYGDFTDNSICYMTVELYIDRGYKRNCPKTKYKEIQGNHVFFNF